MNDLLVQIYSTKSETIEETAPIEQTDQLPFVNGVSDITMETQEFRSPQKRTIVDDDCNSRLKKKRKKSSVEQEISESLKENHANKSEWIKPFMNDICIK